MNMKNEQTKNKSRKYQFQFSSPRKKSFIIVNIAFIAIYYCFHLVALLSGRPIYWWMYLRASQRVFFCVCVLFVWLCAAMWHLHDAGVTLLCRPQPIAISACLREQWACVFHCRILFLFRASNIDIDKIHRHWTNEINHSQLHVDEFMDLFIAIQIKCVSHWLWRERTNSKRKKISQ